MNSLTFPTSLRMVRSIGACLVTGAMALSGAVHANTGLLEGVMGKAVEIGFKAFEQEQRQGRGQSAGSGNSSGALSDLPSAGKNFSSCSGLFPGNQPITMASVDPKWKATPLCFDHFAVIHSALSKTPLMVVERLNRAQMAEASGEERTDSFFADSRLPSNARAELEDYRGSRMDRGHLAAAGNQPNQASMAQSFALSNMVPQDPTNNRKVWSKIESDVRKYVRRAQGDVFVFSGPLFSADTRKIGRSRVWVPSHLFKLVYDEASGRSWAYVLPNTADARIERPMDYNEFVNATGWSPLP